MGASFANQLTRRKNGEKLRTPHSSKSRAMSAFRLLQGNPVGCLGFFIILLLLVLALFGPYISPHDPAQYNLQARFQPPGFTDDRGVYVLGTDQVGRDILSRIIAGSRVSTTIGVLSVAIASVIGVALGIVSGFVGGWIETLLMRLADALLAIPFIILAIAVSGVLGPGQVTLILILGFTGWVTHARVIRSEVLVQRELEYVTAARVIGQSNYRIMVNHILPNVMASAIVLSALQMSSVILAESALSFLGLGVQPPTITWGLMLADGRQYLGSAWWLATFPGLAITVSVLGVVFIGDWLRDVLDPRLRE